MNLANSWICAKLGIAVRITWAVFATTEPAHESHFCTRRTVLAGRGSAHVRLRVITDVTLRRRTGVRALSQLVNRLRHGNRRSPSKNWKRKKRGPGELHRESKEELGVVPGQDRVKPAVSNRVIVVQRQKIERRARLRLLYTFRHIDRPTRAIGNLC